jgi:chromosome segregation protein
MESKLIETGVDKLVNLVKQKGRIALADAARDLGVSSNVIQEWVDFLEEEGILSVEYKLTKPFLVDKKLTKKEVDAKEKEFSSQKDVFVKKAETSLGFLEKQASDLKKVKQEFDSIKSDLGMELDKVRNDLKELEKYQDIKQEFQRELDQQRSDSKLRIGELTKQIEREQKKYADIVTDIKKETQSISKQRQETKSIENAEKVLSSKLAELKATITAIENKVSDENNAIKNSEEHIDKLNSMMGEVRKKVEEEKKSIDPLAAKSRELEARVHELQENVIKKLSGQEKDSKKIKELTKKVQTFFDKKLNVISMVDKLNKDRDDLEKSLMELIKKAKSYELAKDKSVGKDMQDFEKKFSEVEKKKSVFESELKKLTSFFK